MLASTALIVSGINFAYTVKRIGEMQKELDDICDQLDKSKEDTSKTSLASTELTTQMNGFQNKLQELMRRLGDTEEDGISAQDDLEMMATGMNSWARDLLEDLKTVKPDIKVQPPALPVIREGAPAVAQASRGSNQGRGHHHHNHRPGNRRRGLEEEDIDSSFRRRRRD